MNDVLSNVNLLEIGVIPRSHCSVHNIAVAARWRSFPRLQVFLSHPIVLRLFCL